VVLVRLAQATPFVDEFYRLHKREGAITEGIGRVDDRDSTSSMTHRVCAHRMLLWQVPRLVDDSDIRMRHIALQLAGIHAGTYLREAHLAS
jgi:hypothetical protein